MAEELKGEYKLLKVWECHRCKTLIRFGRDISEHRCDTKESEWNKTTDDQNKIIENHKKVIENQKSLLDDRDKYIVNQKNTIEKQLKLSDDQNKIIEDHKKVIENQKSLLDDRDKYIVNQKNTIEKQLKLSDDHKRTIEEQLELIKERDRTIENQKRVIDSRDKVIEDQNKVISDLKNVIKEDAEEDKVAEEKIQDVMDNFGDMLSEKDNNEHITDKMPKADKKIDKQYGGEQIYVDIWEPGKSIKDSKNLGYREDIEIEVFEKGKEKKRIIIKSGRVIKKPDEIDIIGKYTPEGFIIKGIQKKN